MSDSTRKSGAPAQYAAGILLCLVGGFFAVSIVLSLAGQEPTNPGALTWAVDELRLLLGAAGALVLSGGVAVVGALLIVRDEPLATGRLLFGLALCALACGALLAVVGSGGELFQTLLPGLVGRALDLALGLACLWAGAALLLGARGARVRAGDVVRIGLGARSDAASGVTAAEAELLVPEPRAGAPRHGAKREEPRPVVVETIRPYQARKEVPEPARTRRVDPPAHASASGSAKLLSSARPPEAPIVAQPDEAMAPAAEAPPAPPWEQAAELVSAPPEPAAWSAEQVDQPEELEEEDDQEEDLEDATELEDELEDEPVTLAARDQADDEEEEFDDFEEEELEDEDQDGTADEEEQPTPAAAGASPPRVSWEQVGLFDEEEELEQPEPQSPAEGPRELTGSFDFEPAPHPRARAHEPEPDAKPAAPAAAREEKPPAKPAAASPAPVGDFVLEPQVAPAPAPARAAASAPRDDESERWRELVYEAGCAILEQKRVAVSMLERRFGIDFDQACRVLDELQQSGLIGPYMGGRTRDILLSREEWLAQAPHAS